MAQKTNLYSILTAYSKKNNSPYIEIEHFLEYLERYAKRVSEEQPEWLDWIKNKSLNFWSEISALVEKGKCKLLSDSEKSSVFMMLFYPELLNEAYKNTEKDAEIPFPDEESLNITIPENQMVSLNFIYDFPPYLEKPDDSNVPIIKIIFPEDYGSAIVPPGMIPQRLVETAALKIRSYLHKQGNKEYIIGKLTPQLQGRESYVETLIEQILFRPLDCYNAIAGGKEITHLVWAHFCVFVKNDIKKKKERLAGDIAAMQSVLIVEAVNEYQKNLTAKQRDTELAFSSLEEHLEKPPFVYTLTQILRFTNPKGVLLLSLYTKEALEEWLREKTTEKENREIPFLLIIQDPGNEQCFLLKNKMPALCVRLLAEGHFLIKNTISKHWRELLLDYSSEDAMNNEKEFEKALSKYAGDLCPLLSSLFKDPRLLLVYREIERSKNSIPSQAKLFNKDQLLPLSYLFFMQRKDILQSVKLSLPFWYSTPIITGIIRFFRNLSNKKKVRRKPASGERYEIPEKKELDEKLMAAVEELEIDLVPPGYTLSNYMEETKTRWLQFIGWQARENLIEDINSLARHNLRRTLRIQKNFTLTHEKLNEMAINMISNNQTLASLGGRDSLIIYLELYMAKLLKNIK